MAQTRTPLGYRTSLGNSAARAESTATPSRPSLAKMNGDVDHNLVVGDQVAVPGGMMGVVKFIGTVEGKSGTFAGVELNKEFAPRGKNDGDVDGVRYFTTSTPGAGIFLPAHRAAKQDSPTLSSSTFPPTPTTPSFANFNLNRIDASKSKTPPTPSLPKFSQSVGPGARPVFSQSVGPGARAPSPQLKKPRPSLPRPESPLRKTPGLQPTPGRASLRGSRPPASPAPSKPAVNSKPTTPAPARSQSSSRSRGLSEVSPDFDTTPTPARPAVPRNLSSNRTTTNNANNNSSSNEEVKRLQYNLEERDKQLKEQAASLAEMENSLAELQTLMAANAAVSKSPQPTLNGEGGPEDVDIAQLRAVIREKNEKITALTSEFDGHRADFRSTIDTLEMASTETERVYEKRVQELLQEVEELQSRGGDVEAVAQQLKQLEEFVQELEEGLEDARRGEAEARAEVEFLRGEVERARLELRREREKAARALKGAGAAVGDAPSTPSGTRDLEQRDDEIRGLKAIIHSLSSGPEMGSPQVDRNSGGFDKGSSGTEQNGEVARLRDTVEALQREKGELQGMVERKTYHEQELERELTRLRPGSSGHQAKTSTASNATVTTVVENRNSATSTMTAFRRPSTSASARARDSGTHPNFPQPPLPTAHHERISSLSKAIESDPDDNDSEHGKTASTADSTDTDTLWCEICETTGHDVLTCSQMFGQGASESKGDIAVTSNGPGPAELDDDEPTLTPAASGETGGAHAEEEKPFADAPSSAAPVTDSPTLPLPDPASDGPAPGKKSRVVDMSKWCALCERDGHESVDCPFEEDYY